MTFEPNEYYFLIMKKRGPTLCQFNDRKLSSLQKMN